MPSSLQLRLWLLTVSHTHACFAMRSRCLLTNQRSPPSVPGYPPSPAAAPAAAAVAVAAMLGRRLPRRLCGKAAVAALPWVGCRPARTNLGRRCDRHVRDMILTSNPTFIPPQSERGLTCMSRACGTTLCTCTHRMRCLRQRGLVVRVAASTKSHLNPIAPCGACTEWLKKIAEVNPDFTVVTFTDPSCKRLYLRNIL